MGFKTTTILPGSVYHDVLRYRGTCHVLLVQLAPNLLSLYDEHSVALPLCQSGLALMAATIPLGAAP